MCLSNRLLRRYSVIEMKIPIKEVVICEGRYDKIKLDSIIDADIMTLEGFGIFKNEEKRALIRECAKKRGIIVLTDSDSAGMVIRNHIKGLTGDKGVIHLYTPRIKGRESRKSENSKEGLLGVEGVDADTLRAMFERLKGEKESSSFTKAMLYDDGYIGTDGALERRERLAERLGLPRNMSTTALLGALSIVTTHTEYRKITEEMRKEQC